MLKIIRAGSVMVFKVALEIVVLYLVYKAGFSAGHTTAVADQYIQATVIQATGEGYEQGFEKGAALKFKLGV
jgi:hypothetical protein